MTDPSEWGATLVVRRPNGTAADRLERTLRPEAAREVPRATAELSRLRPERLEIRIRATDTGALRAALNTYLGWVALAERTETAAARTSSTPP